MRFHQVSNLSLLLSFIMLIVTRDIPVIRGQEEGPNITNRACKSDADPASGIYRGRQCFECVGKKGSSCWAEPPGKSVGCGFMGDDTCVCAQYWDFSNSDNVTVYRRCYSYKRVAADFHLSMKQVRSMGCETRIGPDEYEVEVCFCEADKCNRSKKYSSHGVPLHIYPSGYWNVIAIGLIVCRIIINY